jgi:hypothetical protein
MGATQSLPSDLTHEKLFELTKDTRGIMNILLEYMLKEITVRDFLALSNPTECKKYVLFKANTLYKYFYELQIMPTKDKKGVIAFRPVKELVAPQSEEAEKERQSLCLILSYYYTRIFQIYGALALTLIDDMEIATRSGLVSVFGDNKQRLLAPGQRSYTTFGGNSDAFYGGAIQYSQLLLFFFLRSFLLDQEDRKMGFRTIYIGEGNSKAEIYFKRPLIGTVEEQERRPVGIDSEGKIQKGYFTIGYLGAKNYAVLEVFAKKEGIGSSNIKFEFGKLKYYKKGSTDSSSSDIPSEVLSKKSLTIVPEQRIGSTATSYSINGAEEPIADYFTSVFNKIVPFLKSLVEGEVTGYTTELSKSMSETGVAEELRLARTIQNLTKTKPYGHCIARALQLLRSAPFKDQPGLSSICKAKFIESVSTSSNGSKTVVSRSGIPLPGTSLDSSPGLAALSQLFYDTIQQGSIKVGVEKTANGKPSSLDQYIEFMTKMAKLFGDTTEGAGTPRSPESYIKSGLKGISNRRDKELCEGIAPNDIVLSSKNSQLVYKYVKDLFRIQYEHAGKCGGIFKQLFDIQRDKGSNRFKISLSDNVLKKGFPEIDRINNAARLVLIDYYSKCETTYLFGMKTVLDAKRRQQPPVAST